MLLSSDLQCRHSLHSPVNTGRTVSPGLRSVTPSPTLSTTLITRKIKYNYKYLISNEANATVKIWMHTLQLHGQISEEMLVFVPAM